MSYHEALAVDEDFSDEEADDGLAGGDVGGLGGLVETTGEGGDAVSDGEVGGFVGFGGVEGGELGADALFALAQVGEAAAELVERDQVFGVGGEEPVLAGAGLAELAVETSP